MFTEEGETRQLSEHEKQIVKKFKLFAEKKFEGISSRWADPSMIAILVKILKQKPIPNRPYTFVDEIPRSIRYIESSKVHRTSLHLGQRKLFLTQLWFLTQFLEKTTDAAYVVYAGAAPTNTMHLLCCMFPNVRFLLIDPNPFVIRLPEKGTKYKIPHIPLKEYKPHNKPQLGNRLAIMLSDLSEESLVATKTLPEQIYIHNTYYTNESSENIKKYIGDVFFWSDIRTGPGGGVQPNDDDILWNSAQQYIWIKILQPLVSMLKFRAPFQMRDEFIDKINNSNNDIMINDINNAKKMGLKLIKYYRKKKFIFLDGRCLIQCWPGKSSTESRLLIARDTIVNNIIVEYNYENYEDTFYFHNNMVRNFIVHKNDYIDKKIGIDNCYDCAQESAIMLKYIEKNKTKVYTVQKIRWLLMQVSPRNMRQEGHGLMYGYDGLFERYIEGALNHFKANNPNTNPYEE